MKSTALRHLVQCGPSNARRLQVIHKRLAPAKLNLGLHVLRRRADGYHDLETVFVRFPWTDTLTAMSAAALGLTCSDPTLSTGEDNLVMKAARVLAGEFGVEAGAALHLEKRLPYGAGLGGGSSDAAAALLLLADLWSLDASEATLHRLAARLGSDVPFFLGPDAAFATGRGEVLEPFLDQDGVPYRLPFPLVVVVPPVQVSTAEAYRRVVPHADGRADLRAVVRSNDLARWRAELVNDFEAPVFEAYPVVREVKRMVQEAGAGYAALSGSGAAVFGVFEDEDRATAAAEAARLAGHRFWHGTA